MLDSSPLLLDTCALIWFFDGSSEELTSQTIQMIDDAASRDNLLMSSISLWEVAQLNSQNRVSLSLPVKDWLDKLVEAPGLTVLQITPDIANLSCDLPGFHKDPADRIIVATSLISQAKLVTRDRLMIKYPKLRNLVESI